MISLLTVSPYVGPAGGPVELGRIIGLLLVALWLLAVLLRGRWRKRRRLPSDF